MHLNTRKTVYVEEFIGLDHKEGIVCVCVCGWEVSQLCAWEGVRKRLFFASKQRGIISTPFNQRKQPVSNRTTTASTQVE